MTKNDRFQVSFPVIHELLPPIDEDVICLKLPRAWFPYVQGYLAPLKANYPYEGEHAKENRDRALKFLELFDGCDVITDLRIQNSRLEAQFCGSETWVLIGLINTIPMRYQNGQLQYDINGDGTYEISTYVDIQQNILGRPMFPIADTNDRLCRAAWLMAREMCDDLNDIVRLIDIGANLLSNAMEMLASWTVILLPLVPTIEFFASDVTQSVLDFFAPKTTDPETIRKVAEMLYCSLVENYPDDLNSVIDDIPLGVYAPFTTLTPNNIQWTNFSEIMQSIYDSATGPNVAYLVVAYARVSQHAIINFNFLSSPVLQTMEYALNTAEYFDERDCVSFECQLWTHELNFSTEALIVFGFPEGLMLNSGCQIASWVGPDQRRQTTEFRVAPFPSSTYGITKVTAQVTTQEETWEAFLLDYEGGPILDSDTTHTTGDNVRVLEPPEPITGLWFWVSSQIQGNSDCPATFSITVTIEGTGVNPFE